MQRCCQARGLTGTDLWAMNQCYAGKLSFRNEEIGQAPIGENPSYYHLKFHSNKSICLETNMTPLNLRCVLVASLCGKVEKVHKYTV